MKSGVVKALFCKISHTGRALYLLSDLILIHAQVGDGPCVTWRALLVQPHSKLSHSLLYLKKKKTGRESTSFPVVLKFTQEKFKGKKKRS